ncbi:MAG TPA: lantibiotic dehydratase, partial [Thermoanaerobaculia bacterium]|nr:lantibiotic dehydratase [Thermoanaerobaculia bacterium]
LALLRIAALPFETLAPLAAGESLASLAALREVEARLADEVTRLTDALHAVAGEPPGEGDPEAARIRLAVIALRRALHNRRRVSPAQLDALREALPRDLFAGIADHLAHRAELATLQAHDARAYRADLLRARRALLALAGRPVFKEGMRLVSRALLDRLQAMAKMDPGRWRHDERHAAAKLTAYAARFATKTSPNSVFCATALAWMRGDEATVSGANRPSRVDVLLSVGEARKVSACLGVDRTAWPAIVPRLNPTLRREGGPAGAWTFWRPVTLRRDSDLEVLSRTKAQPILDLFHDEAARQTLNVPELLSTVSERYEIGVEELTPFFERLVDKGFLIAEIEPPYNTRRPLAFVAETMRAADCEAPWLPEIEALERDVEALSALAPEERIAGMDGIEKRLALLPHDQKLKGDVLFRVDTASGLEVTLPERIRADLDVPLRRYIRLFAALYPETAFRNAYAARFLTRFSADTEIPLLDLYHGLFEPEPQERPESFPAPPPGEDGAATLFDRTRAFFATRARAALAAGEEEVELTDEDWDALVGGLPEPTWSAGVLFQIAARNPEEIAAGRYRMILNALFGPGIALARFAHLLGGPEPDPAVNPVSREVARSWQPLAREGAIFAEITYNHFGRSANAGLRPTLFPYEIELLGERANPDAEVIPLTELTVRWDGTAGRFVLHWNARGVEVVPLITSGVSPEGFVSFLVEIGRQGLQPLAVFPGFGAPGINRWPRFKSGPLVLFRRRWVFASGEAPEPPQESGDPDAAGAAFFAQTQEWRHTHALPRYVFLHTPAEPKPFHVDLDSPLAVDLLRRALTQSEEGAAPPILHVTEMLPGPDEMWIADERGRYAAELLLHLSGPQEPANPR